MEWLRRRPVAWAITCAVVAAAILLGANSSLNRLRGETEVFFREGLSEEDPGIQYDLDWLGEHAYNHAVVAKRYLEPDDPLLTELTEADEALAAAPTPGRKGEAALRLQAAVSTLHDKLAGERLTERERQYNDAVVADVKSRLLIIGRNPYNERATAFNETLERFPANVLSRLTFVRPVELFALEEESP